MSLAPLLFALALLDAAVLAFVPGVREATGGALALLAVPVLGPAVLGFVALRQGSERTREGTSATAPAPTALPEARPASSLPAPSPSAVAQPRPTTAPALKLLAVLQEEARLLDFVREDVSGYSDEQIGTAVRGIHASLRKALDERMTMEPILAGEEGSTVEVPAGFDPAQIRLTGSPSGKPPYRGTLQHGGWKARNVKLPLPAEGSDSSILAPAEVEI